MIPAIRKAYNSAFTTEKYEAFLKELHAAHPGALDFRVAETPVFVPKDFTDKMLDACESIINILVDPSFKELTRNAIPGTGRYPVKTITLNLLHLTLVFVLMTAAGMSPN